MLRKLMLCAATLLLPAVALADHNSRWGEGWAQMPNDIHNTRIDTRGDNTAFRDFVRQGNGADSENRFATSDSRGRQGQAGGATHVRNAASTGSSQRRSSGAAGRRR